MAAFSSISLRERRELSSVTARQIRFVGGMRTERARAAVEAAISSDKTRELCAFLDAAERLHRVESTSEVWKSTTRIVVHHDMNESRTPVNRPGNGDLRKRPDTRFFALHSTHRHHRGQSCRPLRLSLAISGDIISRSAHFCHNGKSDAETAHDRS